ncbi:MAG: hypothetical protein FWE15_09585, partial [Actinomycetia bacterium]|nr:hypothetical protein [Actinomycetes bacterium]
MPEFEYTDLLPLGEDTTAYRLVTSEGVSTFEAEGRTFLTVEPEALRRGHPLTHHGEDLPDALVTDRRGGRAFPSRARPSLRVRACANRGMPSASSSRTGSLTDFA